LLPATTLLCRDELGYLRAESLRVAGRLDEAIAAYHRLNNRSAPPAMRQNALFAAAQLELRMGRPKVALRDFESALAVFPKGVLREDAMAAALDAALAAGAILQAENVAQRYLSAFPNGAAKEKAQAILNKVKIR
jgi:tetratricopeptide (TPR) repeat protein